MAIAIAHPSSPAALADVAQEVLDRLHQDESQQQDVMALPAKVPVWLHQQAPEVRSLLTSVSWLMQLHEAKTIDSILHVCSRPSAGPWHTLL